MSKHFDFTLLGLLAFSAVLMCFAFIGLRDVLHAAMDTLVNLNGIPK